MKKRFLSVILIIMCFFLAGVQMFADNTEPVNVKSSNLDLYSTEDAAPDVQVASTEDAKPVVQVPSTNDTVSTQKPWDIIQVGFFPGVPPSITNTECYGLKFGLPISTGKADMYGVEFAVLSAATEKVHGLQASIISTVTEESSGAQVSIVNICKKLSGVQFGIVNIAKEDSDVIQLGIINFKKNGFMPFFPFINF